MVAATRCKRLQYDSARRNLHKARKLITIRGHWRHRSIADFMMLARARVQPDILSASGSNLDAALTFLCNALLGVPESHLKKTRSTSTTSRIRNS